MITHVSNNANNTNCSAVYFVIEEHHKHSQIFILLTLLFFILAVNLLLIVIILSTEILRGCKLCLQLAASYIGNIVGGLSLIGNDIYYTEYGITPVGCHRGIDGHSLLYFGLAMNLITLMMNTRFRYIRTISIETERHRQQRGFRDFILKCWIPAFVVSLCFAFLASAVETLVTVTYNFLVSVGISVIPITIVIIWNILLGRFLKKSKHNPAVIQQQASLKVIEQAAFVINATILAHVLFLFAGCLSSLLVTFYMDSIKIVIAMNWLLRLSYVALFTVEAVVYMYKAALIRKLVMRKLSYLKFALFGGKNISNQNEDVNEARICRTDV